MEVGIAGKAIDLVLQYTVAPIARQLKYVFCYKSCVAEMNNAIRKLENEKEIVDCEKTAALRNTQLIHKKTDEWLEDVSRIHEDVRSLLTNEQRKPNMNGCCMEGQIVNPIARHQLGRRATKKKLAIEVLHNDRPKLDEISYAPQPSGIVNAEAYSILTKQQTDIYETPGLEKILEKIMTCLKDDSINIIGLHGMGGVGKTTMIKKVRLQVCEQRLFEVVAQAKVTKIPEIQQIQEEIACEIGLKLEDTSPVPRANRLRERLLQKENEKETENDKVKVKEKKKTVLIILDDLWEKLELQDVGIPSSNDQVRIKLLLTSRYGNVLSNKMAAAHNIQLDPLKEKEAWEMFSSAVGKTKVESIKKETATEIVRRCGGLPLAIMAIAMALKNKDLKIWEETLESLDPSDVLKNLKESYKHLPNDDGSKDLFLLCGIIRGPRILKSDLLKYTVGLRLYNWSTLIAAATKLKRLLSGLETATLLVKSDDSRYVVIHDLMRELAGNIVDRDRKEWAYDLALTGRNDIFSDASELKLLLSYGEGDSVQVLDSFFKDMNKLCVMEFTNLQGALSVSISPTQLSLEKLGTLCLHNCSLDDISMIGELKGLQILSFRGSDIRKLPIRLRGLIALRMLDLSDCEKLTKIEPNVLGSLTNLEELNMENSFKGWDIDQVDDTRPPRNARLIELKNMSRLSNVRIHIPSTSMLPEDGQLFSSKLTMYQIMFGVERGKAREYVEDSYIYGKDSDEYNKLSRVLVLEFDSPDILWHEWVQTNLKTVEALYISGRLDEKCESIGTICINGFECLKNLRMRDCPSFRFIISSNDGSCTNLESLLLENLKSLEKLCGGLFRHEETFSKLRVMNVKQCRKLTYLFDFSLMKSRLSSQLEEITMVNCNEIQYIVAGERDNNYDVVTLSSLQKLEFKNLPKLSSFCVGQSSNVLFPGKESLLPVYVATCLTELTVEGCDGLESLCTLNGAASLVHLITLSIKGCDNIKTVLDVASNEENQGGIIRRGDNHHIPNVITFPHLRALEFEDLLRLGSFSSIKNMDLNFPSLKYLSILRCYFMSSFSSGITEAPAHESGDLNSFVWEECMYSFSQMTARESEDLYNSL